ncbi:MAG: hypothetical protein ABI625_23930 [bacterium]
MIRHRAALAGIAVLLLAACDNAPWYEGTYVGEYAGVLGTTKILIANEPGTEHDVISVETAGVGVGQTNAPCQLPAVITVVGNEMTARPDQDKGPLLCITGTFTLTRVNDHTARTTYGANVVEMRKR